MANAITLDGRESKVIVTDYSFGSSSKARYSTAWVFFGGVIGGRDILFLHGKPTQEHEVSLELAGTPSKLTPPSSSLIKSSQEGSLSTIAILSGFKGLVTLHDSDTQLVLYADSDTAATFWAPIIPGNANDPFRNYWSLGTNQTLLVGGPYLVRGANLDASGQRLALTGDLKEGANVTIIAPGTVRQVTWNGRRVALDAGAVGLSSFAGTFVGRVGLSRPLNQVRVPRLAGWRFKDSLPEVNDPSFDDRSWVLANKTTTNLPLKPYYGDGRVLYGCDYGL